MPAPTPSSTSPAPSAEREHPFRYDALMAGDIETRWQQRWAEQKTFVTPNPGQAGFDAKKAKFFCMDMFPYPSAAGLHVGHPEGYIATDIVCRYMRMQGRNVLHPMAWDAFGLPAEQYAIQTGVHPAITTRQAIDNFRRQLQRFGFSYDWSREFATIDPDYYRWTQWIFLRVYESWYDAEQNRARPISELIAEFDSGKREPRLNPAAAEYTGAGDLPGGTRLGSWKTLDHDTQRMVVDSYRLAYVGRQTVNWCPKLGTALANEEVIDGRSERGGFPVFRKPLRQWMFRITAYAQRLLDDLTPLDWPQSTKLQQEEWIGRSEGAEIDFPLLDREGGASGQSLRVFTTRPDTIFGATYMVVAPEHPLVDEVLDNPRPQTPVEELRKYVEAARNRSDLERQETAAKTGVFSGVFATNPATRQQIPVWTSDYVLMGYGHGAIMAVPGQDQRDWDFAKAFKLPIVRTVQPPAGFAGEAYIGDGPAINSSCDEVSLNGLEVAEAKLRIIEWLEKTKRGSRKVNFKLRDWLFSRQRYWGEPFPIVFDERGEHYPVSDTHLPVTLPDMQDYQPVESDEPQPLLAKATDWVNTTAGAAGVSPELLPPAAAVTRETNTMPGWAGSCWYYLRFCDPRNEQRFVSKEAEQCWMVSPRRDGTPHAGGVDLYIGGNEHAVLHLLYSRFWHKVLFDLGEVSTPEPFGRLFHQGMITSHAYQRADKSLVAVDAVKEIGEGKFVDASTGEPVAQVIAKMSKSLKNVINPDDVIAEYGADTFRLYEMYMGPLEASKPWNTRDILGMYRFLQRVWRLAVDEDSGALRVGASPDAAVEKLLHRAIAKVAHDIERLAFNTAIAALIEFVNAATTSSASTGGVATPQLERFTLALAPFAPHMAEEIWSKLGHARPLAHEPWPAVDEAMLRDDEIELPVQIMGKMKGKITVPADADEKSVEAVALADEKIKAALAGKTVRRVIVVAGKIVNIVAN